MPELDPQAIARQIGGRMRECRSAVNWTLQETAQRLSELVGTELPASRLSNWEHGIRIPKLWECLALAEVFGVERERFVDTSSPEWVYLSARLMPST